MAPKRLTHVALSNSSIKHVVEKDLPMARPFNTLGYSIQPMHEIVLKDCFDNSRDEALHARCYLNE